MQCLFKASHFANILSPQIYGMYASSAPHESKSPQPALESLRSGDYFSLEKHQTNHQRQLQSVERNFHPQTCPRALRAQRMVPTDPSLVRNGVLLHGVAYQDSCHHQNHQNRHQRWIKWKR